MSIHKPNLQWWKVTLPILEARILTRIITKRGRNHKKAQCGSQKGTRELVFVLFGPPFVPLVYLPRSISPSLPEQRRSRGCEEGASRDRRHGSDRVCVRLLSGSW